VKKVRKRRVGYNEKDQNSLSDSDLKVPRIWNILEPAVDWHIFDRNWWPAKEVQILDQNKFEVDKKGDII
jgi:hypothetical protein